MHNLTQERRRVIGRGRAGRIDKAVVKQKGSSESEEKTKGFQGGEITGRGGEKSSQYSFFSFNKYSKQTDHPAHTFGSPVKLQQKSGRLPCFFSFPGLFVNLASSPLFPFPHNK